MWKQYGVLAPVVAMVLGIGLAWADDEPEGQPKAVVSETVQDVGVLHPGDLVTVEFEFENHGKADLDILEAKSHCECITLEIEQGIAPQGRGKLRAVLDTSTLTGPVIFPIGVLTNDLANPNVALTLKADIKSVIQALPGHSRFLAVELFDVEALIAHTLWADDGNDFEVIRVESPAPHVTVRFHEARDEERQEKKAGRQWVVETVLSRQAPIGALKGSVLVHVKHEKQKVVPIPISGFVRPIFAITPYVADFGEVELERPLRGRLVVKNYDSEEHKLTRVEEGMEGFETEILPVTDGRVYHVDLILSPEMVKGGFNETVKIHTSSPKRPVLEVRVKGTVL